jgi:hypothetical protein
VSHSCGHSVEPSGSVESWTSQEELCSMHLFIYGVRPVKKLKISNLSAAKTRGSNLFGVYLCGSLKFLESCVKE